MLCIVLPKGTSFTYLTQWGVNLIVNHINSTPRKSLDGKTPYDTTLESFGEITLKTLHLKRVSPDDVHLTPKLIRYNRLTNLQKSTVGLEVNFSHFSNVAGGI